jgi:arsenite methyltransferase
LEPINRFGIEQRRWGFAGYDLDGVREIGEKLHAVYDAIQPPDTDPMLDFDERDLVRLAEEARFFPLRLELRAEIEATEPRRWETFVHQSGNPRIPTLDEAMAQALTADEHEELVAHLRPLVEAGRGAWRMAEAYLTGIKHAE